jgi:hypothetical protein
VNKSFLLRNNSVVPVSFRMIRQEKDSECAFKLSPESGVVPFQSEIRISVTYFPTAAGMFSCETFTFVTPGESNGSGRTAEIVSLARSQLSLRT